MYISYIMLALGLSWCVLCALYEYKYNDDFKKLIKGVFNVSDNVRKIFCYKNENKIDVYN